jgi:hypothetical protein
LVRAILNEEAGKQRDPGGDYSTPWRVLRRSGENGV